MSATHGDAMGSIMRHLVSYGPTSLSRAIGIVCTVSLHILIARTSGPASYASVAFFVTAFSLAGLLLDFGNEQQLIREKGMRSPRARSILVYAPLLAVLVSAALLLLSGVLQNVFSIRGLEAIFYLGMPALVFQALQVLPRAEMQHAQRFRAIAGIEALGSVAAWAAALAMFLSTENPASYGLYTLVMFVVRSALYWARGGVLLSVVQGPLGFAKYFGSWKLFAINAGNRLTTTYDDIVVAGSFGPAMLSMYHLSYRIITLVQDFIAGVLRTLSYPVYAARADDPPAVYRQFCLDSKLVFAVTAPMLTVLVLTADSSIPLILTGQWSGAVFIFQILTLEALRQSMLPLAGQALIAISRESVILRFTLVSTAVLLPLFSMLAFFDLTVFVLGFFLVNSILNIYYYIEVRRAFAQPAAPLLLAWLPGLFASAFLLLLGLLLRAIGYADFTYVAVLLLVAAPVIMYLYARQFADIGHALRHLRKHSDGADAGSVKQQLVIHTDSPFVDDNQHLRLVHEQVEREHAHIRFVWLHYRNDVFDAWKRVFTGERWRPHADRHIVHLHFPVLCYQAKSLPASMLRGVKYLFLLTLMRTAGMRLIVSLHDAGAHDFPHRRWERVFLTLWFQSADAVVTYSATGRAALEHLYGRQMDTHVLSHAMYAAVPPRRSREEMRKELDIRPEHTVLMLLGTNKAYKGFAEFIEAFRVVDPDGITVLCAGEGMASLASRCEAVGVEYRIRDGYQSPEELAACIAAADYGVLPYRRILHSGTVVFFLSHDCPVLAPAIGVLPEYLGEYDIGLLYQAGDGEVLAKILREARQRRRDSYHGEILRFSEDHTVADAAKQLAAVYLRFLSR